MLRFWNPGVSLSLEDEAKAVLLVQVKLFVPLCLLCISNKNKAVKGTNLNSHEFEDFFLSFLNQN